MHNFGAFHGTPQPAGERAPPVYVMFVTDGATFDESLTIEQLIYSAYEPIFWQFMAIGESNQAIDANRQGRAAARRLTTLNKIAGWMPFAWTPNGNPTRADSAGQARFDRTGSTGD